MDNNNINILQKWWFWLIMLLGGGVIIFFIFRKPPAQEKRKNWVYTNPETGKQETVSFAPEPYTTALYEAITSLTTWFLGYTYRDLTPFQNLMKLSDGEFVAVCTDWNNRYKKEYNETLRQAISNEVFADAALVKAMEARFLRLSII